MRDRDIAIAVALVLFVLVFSMPAMSMMGGGMMMGWDGFNPWWGGLTLLFFVLMVAVLVLLVVALARRAPGQHGSRGAEASPAMEILRQRYARGEISREEFDQMRGVLES